MGWREESELDAVVFLRSWEAELSDPPIAPDLFVCLSVSLFRTSRATWRTDRDMGLMNAIGLQPRNPTTSVTSQGTQTLAPLLQNAETQTEREVQEPGAATSGTGEGRSLGSILSLTELPCVCQLSGRELIHTGFW